MSCNCGNTFVKNFTIAYQSSPQALIVSDGSTPVAQCGQTVTVTLPASYDCGKVVFSYTSTASLPTLSLIATNSNCPCEVHNDTTSSPQIYSGTFKPPAAGCRYRWTTTLPNGTPCTITIAVDTS